MQNSLSKKYFNSFYNFTSKYAKLQSTIETYASTNIDVTWSNGSLKILSTNSYNTSTMSPCVDQQFFVGGQYNVSIPSCNTVKSIILSSKDISTVAILSQGAFGGQVAIYDIFQNSTFMLKQNILTDYAEDIIHFNTSDGNFIAIANSYDSSVSALEISYTVPIIVLK